MASRHDFGQLLSFRSIRENWLKSARDCADCRAGETDFLGGSRSLCSLPEGRLPCASFAMFCWLLCSGDLRALPRRRLKRFAAKRIRFRSNTAPG